MMTMGFRFLATAAAVAALFSGDIGRLSLTAAPAAAQGWGGVFGSPVYGGGYAYPQGRYGYPSGTYGYPGGYGYDYGHRRDRGINTGAVVLGALVLGGIAIAASQARRTPPVYGYPQQYPRHPQGQAYPGQYPAYPQQQYPGGYGQGGYGYQGGYVDPAAARDVCARTAAQQGRVVDVRDAGSDGRLAWVSGGVDQGYGVRGFFCAFDGRQVAAFRWQ